jgi:hypothetical protein
LGCQNNLKCIVLALHNYREFYKAFPSAITYGADGAPLHSWRVAVTPFLAQNEFFEAYSFQQAWNGPGNKLLFDEIPEVPASAPYRKYAGVLFDAAYFGYRCPSAPQSQDRWLTNYVMLIDDRPGKPNGLPNRPGSVPPTCDLKSAVIIIEIAEAISVGWNRATSC